MTPIEAGYGPVEALYSEYDALREGVQANSPSDLSALNTVYTKALLIAAASNLEYTVKGVLGVEFTKRAGTEVAEFVRQNVLARGYHTLFDWKSGKATKFFNAFGESSKTRFREYLENVELEPKQRAFIEIGQERNKLVHEDFATYYLSKTPEEIIRLYRLAREFTTEMTSIIHGDTADQ